MTEKFQQGFKVVREKNGRYYSALIDTKYATVEYKRNRRTYPFLLCGALTVFKKLKDALNFYSKFRTRGLLIFECEYMPTNRICLYYGRERCIKCYLTEYDKYISIMLKLSADELPPGTAEARWVRLLYPVEDVC